MKMNMELFEAITEYSKKYHSLKWNDDENVKAFRNLVDMSIKAGKIPECNRNEPSTWSRLKASVTYYNDRLSFCQEN